MKARFVAGLAVVILAGMALHLAPASAVTQAAGSSKPQLSSTPAPAGSEQKSCPDAVALGAGKHPDSPGPLCLLSFCRSVGVRCNLLSLECKHNHPGCKYSCVNDTSCTTQDACPPNACAGTC